MIITKQNALLNSANSYLYWYSKSYYYLNKKTNHEI